MSEGTKFSIGIIGAIIVVMLISSGLGFFGQSLNFLSDSFWKPKYENLNRETFKNSNAYVEGNTHELMNYYQQYKEAEKSNDVNQMNTIKQYVLMGFSNFDADKIKNSNLRQFLINIQNGN